MRGFDPKDVVNPGKKHVVQFLLMLFLSFATLFLTYISFMTIPKGLYGSTRLIECSTEAYRGMYV
jgi:hypothetical protein